MTLLYFAMGCVGIGVGFYCLAIYCLRRVGL